MKIKVTLALIIFFNWFSGHLKAQDPCPRSTLVNELVTNGDFEQGAVGFSNGFGAPYTGTGTLPGDSWVVAINPNDHNSGYFADMQDHTPGAGNKMLVFDFNDASQTTNIYTTTIPTVAAGNTYFFSAWFANIAINNLDPAGFIRNSPQLRFIITEGGSSFTSPIVKVDSLSNDWSQYFTAYKATSGGPITITIQNVRGGNSSNDLAIDDISFSNSCGNIANLDAYGRSSTLPDTIYPCNLALPITLNSGLNGNFTYEWKTSTGAALPGTNTNSSYSFTSIPAEGKYYLCYDSTADMLNCPKKDSVIVINKFDVDIQPDQHLCDPINYTINSHMTDPAITYVWRRNGSVLAGETGPSLQALEVGTYSLTVSKPPNCPEASSTMQITRVTPTMQGEGTYCSTSIPPEATFSVSGVNKINGLVDVEWYTTETGGSPVSGANVTIVDDSTVHLKAPAFISVPGCDYGIYAEDKNAFSTSVTQAVNPAVGESIRNSADTRTKITVYAPMTIDNLQIYQHDNSTGGTSTFEVRIYANTSGNRCGPTGDVPSAAADFIAVSTVTFPKTTTPTLRTLPVNITLPGSPAGTVYWIGITGAEHSYFSSVPSFPVSNTTGIPGVLTMNEIISQSCPKPNESGNIVGINATVGKTNSCGRVFVCATVENCTAPVQFLGLKVSSAVSGAQISWATASEENNSHFIVQRSIDGVNFGDIGQVKGTGNSAEIINYSFRDSENFYQTVYYRIMQVDFDGHFSYSRIQHLNPGSGDQLVVYPVPVKSGGTIRLKHQDFSGRVTVNIYDLSGKIAYQETLEDAEHEVSVNAPLGKGVYFAELIDQYFNKKIGRVIVE